MDGKLEIAKKSLHSVEDLEKIKNNPLVNSLIQGIPIIGNLVDTTMESVIQEFQEKKIKELEEIILNSSHEITSDMVNDVEFIMNFAKTKDAVFRLATNDKVKYFGNLIRNGYLSGEHIENDIFEEYLEVLNTMSYREIQYLTDYKLFCDEKNKQVVHEALFVYDYFDEFASDYSKKTGISETDIYDVFARLKRTGFVDENFEDGDDVPIDELGGFYIQNSFLKFYDMVLKDNSE